MLWRCVEKMSHQVQACLVIVLWTLPCSLVFEHFAPLLWTALLVNRQRAIIFYLDSHPRQVYCINRPVEQRSVNTLGVNSAKLHHSFFFRSISVTCLKISISERIIGDTAGSRQFYVMQSQCRIHRKTAKFCQDSNDILHCGKFFNCTGNNKKWSCQVQNVSQNSNHPPPMACCRIHAECDCRTIKFHTLQNLTFCRLFVTISQGAEWNGFATHSTIPSTLGKIIGFQQWENNGRNNRPFHLGLEIPSNFWSLSSSLVLASYKPPIFCA